MITASANYLAVDKLLVKEPIFALEIADYARIFTSRATGIPNHYPWIADMEDLAASVSDMEGTSSLDNLKVTILDGSRLFTADLAANVLEGRKVIFKQGYAGLSYTDWLTMFTGKVNLIPMASNNTYTLDCVPIRGDLKRVVYLTGDDGQPTSSDHVKTLIGNPLDIALSVMIDEVGMDPADIDVAYITNYRDQVFAGFVMEFNLDTAPEAKSFIETEIMKPLGGYLRETADGKITMQFFMPLPGTGDAALALTDQNIIDLPILQQSDLVNAITFRFDRDGDKWRSQTVLIDGASDTKYGQQGQSIIESQGMRSGFQGFALADMTAAAIFGRYGDKNPTFDTTTHWRQAARLELGDIVLLTHALLPDRSTGTVGITNKRFEVINRIWKFSQRQVELTLVDASGGVGGIGLGGRYRIAPDGTADFTAADDPTKNKYMFVAGADGNYSDATPGHRLA